MPVYEYFCSACGTFAESQPMQHSARPVRCPGCGQRAPRILSAPAVGRPRGRRARGSPEPKLVQREPVEPKSTAADRLSPSTARPHHHDRPWMLGH